MLDGPLLFKEMTNFPLHSLLITGKKLRASGPATGSGDKRRYDERTKCRRSSSQSRAAVPSASKPAIMLKNNSTRWRFYLGSIRRFLGLQTELLTNIRSSSFLLLLGHHPTCTIRIQRIWRRTQMHSVFSVFGSDTFKYIVLCILMYSIASEAELDT